MTRTTTSALAALLAVTGWGCDAMIAETDAAHARDAGLLDDGGTDAASSDDAGRDAALGADGGADASAPVDGAASLDAATLLDAWIETAPRPIAPLSTATVTSRRPTLRWALPPGTDGARVELCRDRACARVIATIDAIGSSAAPSSDLPSGVVFWRLHARTGATTSTLTSPTWQFWVGRRSAPVDASWGSRLDANGDGLADLAVGGYAGARFYLGGAGGLSPTPAWTRDERSASLASAGDVDGDGYADLIAGTSEVGIGIGAQLFRGGPGGLESTPSWSMVGWDLGEGGAGAGDVNGDGYADVIAMGLPMRLYLGSAGGLASTPAWTQAIPHPYAVASAGDVDADGFADVVVGDGGGTAYVFRGSAAGLDASATWVLTSVGNFGWWVAGAGDVDGDGYADVLVGDTLGAHALSLFRGGPSGIDTTAAWTHASIGIELGFRLAAAGDIDGDGYDDIVAASKGICHTMCPGGSCTTRCDGAAYVFAGGPGGLGASPSWSQSGAMDAELGADVAGVGDVDGDGFPDLVLGAEGAFSAYLYAGSATGPSVTPAWSVTIPDLWGFGDAIAR
jgi:hypothetical protein